MIVNIDEILYTTPTRRIVIDKLVSIIEIKNIQISINKFLTLCSENCINFNSKYSCPPFSPSFSAFAGNKINGKIICYRLNLNQYAPLPVYHRIRASNAVLKSLIDKELHSFKENGTKVAGSGSCRACKPCGAKTGIPCKKPDRKIYSLEAMGVDVDKLVQDCFGFNLQWYIKGEKTPDYTCVVGAVLL